MGAGSLAGALQLLSIGDLDFPSSRKNRTVEGGVGVVRTACLLGVRKSWPVAGVCLDGFSTEKETPWCRECDLPCSGGVFRD